MQPFQPRIIAMGSINQDFVMRAERMPEAGETVLGEDLRFVAGGKGANQAVAAARLGAQVAIIGRVGDDVFGHEIRANFEREGVDTSWLTTDQESHTGAAFIALASNGQNRILSLLGVNARVTAEEVSAAEETIAAAQVFLLTVAVPKPAVEMAVRLCKKHGVRIHLDPTPLGPPLPGNWREVELVTPNETEASPLCGFPVTDLDTARLAAEKMRAEGIGTAVVKLGAQGCIVADDAGTRHIPAFTVDVVDTTAAGDAFAAALGVRVAEGAPIDEALRWASAVGGMTTTVFGAQPSLPKRDAVEAFLAARA